MKMIINADVKKTVGLSMTHDLCLVEFKDGKAVTGISTSDSNTLTDVKKTRYRYTKKDNLLQVYRDGGWYTFT